MHSLYTDLNQQSVLTSGTPEIKMKENCNSSIFHESFVNSSHHQFFREKLSFSIEFRFILYLFRLKSA